jgi:hypothetical protein
VSRDCQLFIPGKKSRSGMRAQCRVTALLHHVYRYACKHRKHSVRTDDCDYCRHIWSIIQQPFREFYQSRNGGEKKYKVMSVEVPKSQHKYVIGDHGNTIAEILQTIGVSVEMPPDNSTTDTITLRGPHDKLGLAMSMVYEKAYSVQTATVDAPNSQQLLELTTEGQLSSYTAEVHAKTPTSQVPDWEAWFQD